MKEYSKAITSFDPASVIQHKWGQSPESIYRQVVKIWNTMELGNSIAVVISKQNGAKSVKKYLEQQGLEVQTVAKDANNIRVLRIIKDRNGLISIPSDVNMIEFKYGEHLYKADVGQSIFSRKSLDAGTHQLLDYIIANKLDLHGKSIFDFGSGWGAIGIVLSRLFPTVIITMLENDEASLEAAQLNLGNQERMNFILTDMVNPEFVEKFNVGNADFVICNPPFHISSSQRELLFELAHNVLSQEGQMIFVVEGHFEKRFKTSANKHFLHVAEMKKKNYTVLHFKKFM